MLTRWDDLDRAFSALDEMRRRMDRLFQDVGAGVARPGRIGYAWPPTNLYDDGENLVLVAEVPGLADKDLNISATAESIGISGTRSVEAPKGYSVHRQERGAMEFARTFTLPSHIKPDKTMATVKNGLLTIRMPKAEESRPKQITVKAQ